MVAYRSGFHRESHLDIRGAEGITGKPFLLLQMCLKKRKVIPDLRLQPGLDHLAAQRPRNRPHEEWHWPARDFAEHQLHDKQPHRRPLGVMQEVAVVEHSLAIAG